MSTVIRQARRTLAVVLLSVGLVILAAAAVSAVAWPVIVIVFFGNPTGYWRGVLVGVIAGAGLLAVGTGLLLWERHDAREAELSSTDGE